MRKTWKAIIAVSALVMTGAVHAQNADAEVGEVAAGTVEAAEAPEENSIYYNDGSWIVSPSSDGCFLYGEYESGNIISLIYDPSSDEVYFNFSNDDATSIKQDQKVELYTFFLINGEIDDGWGRKPFTASIDDDGGVNFARFFEGRVFLDDLSKATGILFTIDAMADRRVAGFKLTGSAKAVAALRKCAFENTGLNPNDPFLQ